MKFGKPLLALASVAACLLAQACVTYIPENGAQSGPPPQPSPPQYAESASSPPVPPSAPPQAPNSSLDTLVAPIALYPDPLIALILPASTMPADISAASAYLIQYGDATQIDSQPWDPSVRALAHYPTVITWMADNMAWTNALGAGFSSSPSDVMASIQRLRARAMASGALVASPQEQVYSDEGDIDIVPAQPDGIYVPSYDADAVFGYGPYGGPPIEYGTEYPSGIWLSYSVDWHRRSVWVADAHAQRGPGGWYNPHYEGNRTPPGARSWNPPPGHASGQQAGAAHYSAPVPRPGPIAAPSHSMSPGFRGANGPATPQRGPAPQVRQPAPSGTSPGRAPGHEESHTSVSTAPGGSQPGRAPASEATHSSAPQPHQEPAHDRAPAPSNAQDPKDRDQTR